MKRLDHVNVLADDMRPSREFSIGVLGYRLHEGIRLDNGRRPAPGSASRSPPTS